MKHLIFVAAVALAGCASTAVRPLVGQPIDEALIKFGKPEQVFALQDGRRAYQFRWGGGTVALPGSSSVGAYSGPGVAVVATSSTPGMIYDFAGCLVTLIASQREGGYVVDEYRIPKRLVC